MSTLFLPNLGVERNLLHFIESRQLPYRYELHSQTSTANNKITCFKMPRNLSM